MNVFRYLIYSATEVQVLVIVGAFLANALYGLGVALYLTRYHRTHNNVPGAMTRYRIFSQYVYIPILAVFVFFITLAFAGLLRKFGHVNGTATMVLSFTAIFLLIMENQFVYYRVIKHIRETSVSLKGQLGAAARQTAIMLLPIALINIVIQASRYAENSQVIQITAIVAFALLINALTPWLYKFMLKARPFEESPEKTQLESLLELSEIRNAGLFSYPGKGQKNANAVVTGLFKKRIFISDYLMENLDGDELSAILGHEIGHIKKLHVPVRIGLILLIIPLFMGAGKLIELIKNYIHIPITFMSTVAVFAVLALGYVVGIRLWIIRAQEYAADAFACTLGSSPRILASALKKIAQLNHSAQTLHAVDEKLQTHPSIARRVARLENMT